MRCSLSPRLAAAILIGLPFVLSFAGAPSSATSGPPHDAGQRSDPREEWWRDTAVHVLDLDGAWALRTEPAVTFLEPEGPGCVLRLLRRSSGEVIEYAMRPEGQVALAFGWVFVSNDRELVIADRFTAPSERPEGYRNPGGGAWLNSRDLERIRLFGDAPVTIQAIEGTEPGFRIWRRNDSTLPSSIVIQAVLGTIREFSTGGEETLMQLELTWTPSPGRPGLVKVFEVPRLR